MKIHFSLLLVVLLPAANGQPQPRNDSPNDLLSWNEFYELQWYDFQGTPGDNARGDAGTAVQIKAKPFRVKNTLDYDVVAVFNRKKSWSRDQSPALLAHERLHFDIAELYARKIRKKIAELQASGVNDVKTYNAEIEKLLSESNDADYQYDIETLHGALLRKQEAWTRKVKDGLKKLERHKKTKRIIRS